MDRTNRSQPGPDKDMPTSSTAAMSERRSANRYRSVCRIARVKRANDVGLWRIRNISDKGMMLQADVEPTGGEEVEIALSEDTLINGRIVWADKGCCGIAFDEPVDVEETLASLARQQQAESYRALRLPVEAEAILVMRKVSRAIDLVNISQSGAGFRTDIPIEVGSLVDLLLPGEDVRRTALIRWSRGLCGGLWFTKPIDRRDLESIARFAPR